MPPMIIYAKSFPGGQYRFDGPEDALYAKSDSGWIDSELFLAWLNKIFVKFCVPERYNASNRWTCISYYN